jgi:transposase
VLAFPAEGEIGFVPIVAGAESRSSLAAPARTGMIEIAFAGATLRVGPGIGMCRGSDDRARPARCGGKLGSPPQNDVKKSTNLCSLGVAMSNGDALPEDAESLRALVLKLQAERDELAGALEQAQHIIQQLQRAQFGRRSEKLDPDQLQLALEAQEIAQATDVAAADKQRKAPRPKEPGKRKSLPANLPRIEVVIEPETTTCPCCNGVMHVIGEEKSERLDVIPAQFRILVTRRPKYACRACAEAIIQAPAPERLIRSGLPTEALVAHVLVSKYAWHLPTEALVAHVLVSKYAWHLPLYRQAQIMLAQGIEIDRSVLAFWVGYAAVELMPIWRRMREILLGSARLFVDETRAPVLDPGRGRTKTGYFWSIARDDRASGSGADPPAVVYTYAPGRGGVHATALLQGYCGIVQCDGYVVYEQLANPARKVIAALVAGPSFVHPDDWMPLIFAGRRPALDAGSLEHRIVKTVFDRYNEVSEILADRPDAYRPIFRSDDRGKVTASDWVVGFMLGLGLRRAEWEKCILLTQQRALLTPILVYSPASTDLLPEMRSRIASLLAPSRVARPGRDMPAATRDLRAGSRFCDPVPLAARRPATKVVS